MILARILGGYKSTARNKTFSKEDLLDYHIKQVTFQMNKKELDLIKLLLAQRTQKIIPTQV